MIADMSTTNLTFFHFFSEGERNRPASGKRTIARAVFRTQVMCSIWVPGPSAA